MTQNISWCILSIKNYSTAKILRAKFRWISSNRFRALIYESLPARADYRLSRKDAHVRNDFSLENARFSAPTELSSRNTMRREHHAIETSFTNSTVRTKPLIRKSSWNFMVESCRQPLTTLSFSTFLSFSSSLFLARMCAKHVYMWPWRVFRRGEDRRGTLNHRLIPSPRWIVHLYTRTPFVHP